MDRKPQPLPENRDRAREGPDERRYPVQVRATFIRLMREQQESASAA